MNQDPYCIKPDWFDKWFEATFQDKTCFSVYDIVQNLKNISLKTVYNAVASGELEAFIIGKRRLVIPREALYTWLINSYSLNRD